MLFRSGASPSHRAPRRRAQMARGAGLLVLLLVAPWWGKSNQGPWTAPRPLAALTTQAQDDLTPEGLGIASVVKPASELPSLASSGSVSPTAVPATPVSATVTLTATATATALGAFTYTPNPDGSITQDPNWVKANIVTETVPLLGAVTCNKVMFPQLSGAMADLDNQGLSGLIDQPDLRYGHNCYQPRFVDSDPSRGISYHAWGIAIDINRSANPEGRPSRQDPRLVETMRRWGFRWGGIWTRPDPMHFELPNVLLPQARIPVTVTASAPASVALGTPVSATAQLSGGSQPTGVVAFSLFGPDDPACKGPALATSTATAIGTAPVSVPVVVTAPGTYRVVASYGGDAGNDPVSSACGRVLITVTRVPVTLNAVPGAASAPSGSSVSITGKLAGAPIPSGGTLNFLLYGPADPACQGPPAVMANQTVTGAGNYDSGPLTPSAPGTYQWVISYSGDGDNPALATDCGSVPVSVGP